jgi:integrase
MAINKTAAGTWSVDFRDQHKHRIQRTFDTRKEAAGFEKLVLAEVSSGEYSAPSRKTVAEIADEWYKKKLNAEQSYRRSSLIGWEAHIRLYIKPSLGEIRCRDLTIEQVEKALAQWGKRVSPVMANKVLTTLAVILDLAKRYKHVRDNVARDAERLKLATEHEGEQVTPDKVFTALELRRVIEVTEPETAQRLMVMIPALTGLRIGEVLGLTWPCVDLKSGKIEVRYNLADTDKGQPQKLQPPKSKTSRRTIQSVPAELIRELKVWKLKCPVSEQQFVLAREDGQPYHRAIAGKVLNAAVKKAGVQKRLTPHSLRHTCASLALDASRPVAEVTALLGHSDSAITLRVYTHFCREENKALTAVSQAIFGS